MKFRILTIFLALFVLCSHGQVIIKSGNQLSESEQAKLAFLLDAPEIKLPNIDYTEIEDKGRQVNVGEPFQFGLPHIVNIGIGDGKWFEDEEGQKKRWKVKINSP
jgi:hypothetical protein